MKRLAALLLAGIMILSLAACSTDDSTTASTEQPAASQSTPEPQTEEQPADTQSASDTQTTEEQPADTQSTSETQTEDQPTVSEEGAAAEQSQAGDETGAPAEETTGSDSEQGDSAAASSNILIAYFSVPETDGVDAVAGASRVVVDGEVLGNTQYIAQLIQQQTGGDLFRIETVQEYPGSHDPLLEFAYNERAEGARPELAAQMENLDSYDIIFLGYSNWNADLPMPLYTLLEQTDLSGKTIVPFTTHGGSGFSRTIQAIQELQPNVTVISDGLSISRNSVAQAEGDVASWVSGLGLIG